MTAISARLPPATRADSRPGPRPGPRRGTASSVVEDVLVDDLCRQTREPTLYLPAVTASPVCVMKSHPAERLEPEVRASSPRM